MTKKELNQVVSGLLVQISAAQTPANGENETSEDEARTLLVRAIRKLKPVIVDTAVPVSERPSPCLLDTFSALKPAAAVAAEAATDADES